ncbi:MAG: SWIM zinc finger family protein [Bryobacteraceae bacterium]|nr:SWIM zinc finger family protein [Bryobacteraceae bacterium]
MSSLSTAITDAAIRRLAGGETYRRGYDYYRHGHVESLDDEDGGVRARVRGNRLYKVALSDDDGVLDYDCNCPQGADGAFCKHCVAAALACLNRGAKPAAARRRGKAKQITLADAGKILGTEDSATLARMVIDWAKEDDWLRERILLYAARRSGPEAGAAEAARAFERAARVHDYVDYREAGAWADGVDGAIDHVEQLLEDGQPAAVIELCESALQQLANAIEFVDDSDGHFTGLRDRLEDIHLRACREARPDPVALAGRLFRWELRTDFEVFYKAVERYAKILGAQGLKEYRRLAEAEWAKVPVRTAKHEHSEEGRSFRIRSIMESLAQASGNVDELVAVMSRDLSHAYSYLRIAEVFREARRHDEALQWAEKGLRAFPERTDGRLREFAAEEYHRRRRHDDAMKLIWAGFSERPYLDSYQTLERHAKKAGNWPEWRDRALAEFRRHIAEAKGKLRPRVRPVWMETPGDHSQLVEIFLYERDPEAAWREAQEGGCSSHLWLQLAAAREKDHPADAAPLYLKHAESAVAATTNGRYEDPVALLIKAAAVMKRMGRSAEFVTALETLRAKFKIKRNFIKLIERKRQSLYLS